MGLNNLTEAISSPFGGDLMYSVFTAPIVLGGKNLKRYEELLLVLPQDFNNVKLALLIINASLSRELGNVYWKVRFNNIMLSREFKPQIVTTSNEGIHLTFIYDVKPIIRPNQRKNILSIGFEASEPITIENSMLFLIHDVPKAFVDVNLSVGTSIIEPNTALNYKVSFRKKLANKGRYFFLINIPSKICKLSFAVNDKVVKEISELIGSHEIEVEYPLNSLTNKLSIVYHAIKGKAFPREVKVNTLLAFQRLVPEPKIITRVKEVKKLINKFEIDTEIENVGDVKAKNVIVQVMSVGAILARKIISEINAGEKIHIKLSATQKLGSSPLILRTIYRVGGRTLFNDIKLK